MSSVIIKPCNLSGEVTVPASKSISHRAIICAALSKSECSIRNISMNDDIKATIRAVGALGVDCFFDDGTLYVDAENLYSVKDALIDCGESGSTLRFLIPMAAAGGMSTCFQGHGLLPMRPIGPYLDCLPKAGVKCTSEKGLPLMISGKLIPSCFYIPGNISSQFITGLLMVLPILDGNSEIILTSPLESKAYVDITIGVMKDFGVSVEETEQGYRINGGQSYKGKDYTVEGDWSQAAFWIAAGTVSQRENNTITIKGLNRDSSQGDKEVVDIFNKMGADLNFEGNDLVVKKAELKAVDFEISENPDLFPPVAIAAMFAEGITNISGAYRLKFKESDRLIAVSLGINCLGGKSRVSRDAIWIEGIKQSDGGDIDGFNDHRIVMSMSIASLRAVDNIIISDAHSINKSYPEFFEVFNRLGGKADVIDIR